MINRRVLFHMLGTIIRAFAVFRFKNLVSLFSNGRSLGSKGYPVQKGYNETNYVQVNNVEQLAMLWTRFDFKTQLGVLAQMMERFGTETLLRATDPTGKTVCHWIAYKGTLSALKYTIDCDPSIVNDWRADRANPLIHLAFMGNNLDLVDALLELGLDLNATNQYGQNVITQCILTVYNLASDVKTYDIILRANIYGIDVNSPNVDTKQTALHYAVQRFYEQDVHLLLKLGADPTLVDNWGRTPYDCALKNGNQKLASLISPEKSFVESKKPSPKEKITSYWTLLTGSTMIRSRELIKWGGTTFSIVHLSIFSLYLLPTYFLYYLGHTKSLWPVHFFLISCLILMAVTGILTVFSMANFLPTDSSDYVQLMSYLQNPTESPSKRAHTLDQFQASEGARLCHICSTIAPKHSKHCYLCNRCCIDYDHHCVFLRTCIGGGNINLFTAFAAFLGFSGALGLVVIIYSLSIDLAALALQVQQYGFLYRLWKALSLFSIFNTIICAQFMAVGLGMASTTYIQRKRTLAYRKVVAVSEPLVSVKLV